MEETTKINKQKTKKHHTKIKFNEFSHSDKNGHPTICGERR